MDTGPAANDPRIGVAQSLVPLFGNATVILLVLMLLLFVVGLPDGKRLSAIVILAPILVPIGIALGVDPLASWGGVLHQLVIGIVTPPLGSIFLPRSPLPVRRILRSVARVLPFYGGCDYGRYKCLHLCSSRLLLFLPNLGHIAEEWG